jgi:hypothetical protein
MCCLGRPGRPARPCPTRTRWSPSPRWEALVRLARCARRLRDGDDPLAVRRAIDRVRADARHAGYDYLSVQCLGLAAAAAAAGPDRP